MWTSSAQSKSVGAFQITVSKEEMRVGSCDLLAINASAAKRSKSKFGLRRAEAQAMKPAATKRCSKDG